MLTIRSLAFNALFYGWTLVFCLGALWLLVLPHAAALAVIEWYLRTLSFLERTVVGMHWEVRGAEHLPKTGAFLVAAKHQSMWETMKLHLLLHDPAVVMKRELLLLPLWGWYAWKMKVIPVHRGKRGSAINSLIAGARKVKEDGRPIVIFPQGTRTAPGEWRPYKVGIAALYEKLDLPIVPMALNTGMFWGRRTFIRKPGTATIEFLAPIPAGLPKEEVLKRLEAVLEPATDRLVTAVGGPATARPAHAPLPGTDAAA